MASVVSRFSVSERNATRLSLSEVTMPKQMRQRAAEPVELPHDQHIAGPDVPAPAPGRRKSSFAPEA
jgi:hypothetical protein